jgi:putative acetyltransferase
MALLHTDPTLRVEGPGDASAVRAVVEAAFGRPDEADVVDRLRTSDDKIHRLWMVAELNHRVVGHIAYSRITVEPTGLTPTSGPRR